MIQAARLQDKRVRVDLVEQRVMVFPLGVVGVVVAAAMMAGAAGGRQFEREPRGMLDPGGIVTKFRDGLNMAGKFLGLDTSQGVANLVSSSFANVRPAWLRNKENGGLFTGFFRLMGFDSTKLGAIALNALIFVAQMISSSLSSLNPSTSGPQEKFEAPTGTPLSWILDNPSKQVATLLGQAQQRSLPDLVIESIAERSAAASGSTECVQLLVCKCAPFVWGMQRGLKAMISREGGDSSNWTRLRPIQRMYEYLPERREFLENGHTCEDRFPECIITL